MSNTYKYLLLVIATVIVCISTSLLASKAFAQSELMFPVNKRVSYQAPDLQTVFSGHVHIRETIAVAPIKAPAMKPAVAMVKRTVTKVVVITSEDKNTSEETDVQEKETSFSQSYSNVNIENDFLSQSTLIFPVTKTVSYSAPNLSAVFTGREYRETAVTTVKAVRVKAHNHNKKDTYRKNTAVREKIEKIERQIAELEKQVAMLKKELQISEEFGCGSCGTHVEKLQKFLNKEGFTLAANGAGSKGSETKFFGPRTLKALKQFQSAYGIPVTGIIDAETKNLINSIESNVIGKITVEDCVSQNAQKGKNPKKAVVEIPQDDIEKVSGNFFTDLIQKIFGFFLSLFQWS